jgi:DHA1 family inner membrane transport protein
MPARWLDETRGGSRAAAVAALGALWVGTFCVSTTENLPAGLLPQLSAGLRVSLFAVGQLVAGYALTVAVLSVPLAYATKRFSQRPLLITLMALFAVASLGSALAPDYGLLLAARVLTALVHCVWWAVVTVAAVGLYRPAVQGRVMSVLNSATAVATILGIPAGTWLGQQAGWRAAFVALSVLGLAALVLSAVFLPSAAKADAAPIATGIRPDARRYFVLLAAIVITLTGLTMAFTYTVPFLTSVSHFSDRAVSPLLLVRGGAGFASVALAGNLVDRVSPRLASVVPVATLAVAFLGLFAFGPVQVLAVAFIALSGVGLFTMLVSLTSEVLVIAPVNLYVASACSSAAFNVGATFGALFGGLLLPAFGVRSTAGVGGLLAVAAVVVLLAGRPSRG